jgi:hypothetical protein
MVRAPVACVQEQQIRARQRMKQLSKRMMEQRMQALERIRTNMMSPQVRILPRDMEQGLKEFAAGVEQLVDRLVRTACALISLLAGALMIVIGEEQWLSSGAGQLLMSWLRTIARVVAGERRAGTGGGAACGQVCQRRHIQCGEQLLQVRAGAEADLAHAHHQKAATSQARKDGCPQQRQEGRHSEAGKEAPQIASVVDIVARRADLAHVTPWAMQHSALCACCLCDKGPRGCFRCLVMTVMTEKI